MSLVSFQCVKATIYEIEKDDFDSGEEHQCFIEELDKCKNEKDLFELMQDWSIIRRRRYEEVGEILSLFENKRYYINHLIDEYQCLVKECNKLSDDKILEGQWKKFDVSFVEDLNDIYTQYELLDSINCLKLCIKMKNEEKKYTRKAKKYDRLVKENNKLKNTKYYDNNPLLAMYGDYHILKIKNIDEGIQILMKENKKLKDRT